MEPLEAGELRQCLRDLIALAMLPSLWTGAGSEQIAASLSDALFSALRADLVYVRIVDPGGRELEAARAASDRHADAHGIGVELAPALDRGRAAFDAAVLGEPMHLVANAMELAYASGVVVAGARRAGFPTEAERVLIRVGTNQAAIALRAARHLAEMEEVSRTNARLVAELEEASRLKDEFLAILGHELRNPLGAILAARTDAVQARSAERANVIIDRQVEHLTRLVDDLLEVSRIRTGKIVLARRSVDLNEVAERVSIACEHSAHEQRHTVVLERAPAPLWVDGDTVRLEQVVMNLLHNAIKYTPPGGHVRVALASEGDSAVLRVIDDGCGIEPALLGRVFEPFVQADRSLDRAQGGLGLGLPFVKGLVTLHGGSVEAASDGVERGSTFLVRLPLAPHVEEAPRPEAPPSRAEPQKLRVLVVDDNLDIAETMAAFIEAAGHSVDTANDGIEGVDKALALAPDVLFVDIGLPGLDGYEVAKRIRAELASAVVLVAVSGYGSAEDRRLAEEAGFDQHLVKPVLPAQILRVLSDYRRPG
jgi:signal transduction histidine kinase/CheY-like chemotaxis protein